MRRWVNNLAKWCRLPALGGFAELDIQIDKMRMLRDSYQHGVKKTQYGTSAEEIASTTVPA